MIKLSVLLGKTDYGASLYRGMIQDFTAFFKKSQGAFKGVKRTYEPREGTVDEPSKRENTLIQTTVGEKLDWFMENAFPYINALFIQEKTNASGRAVATLMVDGVDWGEFTSLELLRLKSILEDNSLKEMIANIPVRSDAEEWKVTDSEDYEDKDVWESKLFEGVAKTTVKESYILLDPNVDGDSPSYKPQVATKNTVQELGDYTIQKFSGEISQRKRAEMLKKRSTLLIAVIAALKECNEVEIEESGLTANKVFGFIFDI